MSDANPPLGSTVPPEPPDRIGDSNPPTGAEAAARRYRPERFHARGGLGEVWLARDQELHRDVALKSIQARHGHDAESRRRFLLEAEITARLEHPGVVPVYGLHQGEDGQPCYAMRFIRGETLRDAIQAFHEDQSRRDPGERSVAFRQLLSRFVAVCNTVAYAHSRGILHRDLKPANVMLGKYGETLVVDWGLAKPFERDEAAHTSGEDTLAPSGQSGEGSTLAGQVLGTPAFMSPEQAAGKANVLGPAGDIYSLGATLYAILTGRPPFEGRTDEILARVQAGQVSAPELLDRQAPRPLAAVCRKAMALKPEERYSSALELAAEVERWLADEPVQARRETVVERVQRGCRRWPLLAALFTLFGVADVSLVVGVAATLFFNRQPEVAIPLAGMMPTFVALGAIAFTQITALLGGVIGWGAGGCSILMGRGRFVRLGTWSRFGARSGLVAGFPLGVLAFWVSSVWMFPLFHIVGESPASYALRAFLRNTAIGVGLAGSPVGALLGVLIGVRRRPWLTSTGIGACIGAMLSLILGCLILTTSISAPRRADERPEPRVTCLAYSADGARMVGGWSPGYIGVYDSATGKTIWNASGHPGSPVRLCVFSPDQARIASAAVDGSVRIWDARTGESVVTLRDPAEREWVDQLAFNPNGSRLVGVYGEGEMRIWDTRTGLEVYSQPSQPGWRTHYAFSPDGKRSAVYGAEGLRVLNDFWDR